MPHPGSFGLGWHCDPVAGTGLVDGVFVITDSINRRTVDRVMPIVAEEQVIFCRFLREQLTPGERIVDVGSGSGILGLYAAKICGASVTALDFAVRSCRFTRNNARLNNIPLHSNPADVRSGHIAVLHQEFSRFCRRRNLRSDVFILNPPFTPTLGKQSIALHARGGFDGQQAMIAQLRVVQPLLRPGNRIIGFQMTCGRAPDFGLGEILRATMKQPFVAEWCSTIRGGRTLPAEVFLPAIYSNCGTAKDRRSRLRAFTDLGMLTRDFSLIMYVVEVKRAGYSSLRRIALPAGPLGTWDDRIWLHQRILDGIPEPVRPFSSAFGMKGQRQ